MAKKRIPHQPQTKPDPIAETEKAFLAGIAKDPSQIGIYTDWLQDIAADGTAGPEQNARLEFIQVQRQLEKAKLSDKAGIQKLKAQENGLLEQWGDAFARKDMEAAGFTPEQLQGLQYQWMPFSGGFSLPLIKPELLENVKATHALMDDATSLTRILRGIGDDAERVLELLVEEGYPEGGIANVQLAMSKRGSILDRFLENHQRILDPKFWDSGNAVKTLLRGEINESFAQTMVNDLALSYPALVNGNIIGMMAREGVDMDNQEWRKRIEGRIEGHPSSIAKKYLMSVLKALDQCNPQSKAQRD